MNVKTLLLKKKSPILKSWFTAISDVYPKETAEFILNQKERFTNPMGHTFREGIEGIFNTLIQGTNERSVTPFINNILKIKAVQEFSPSQAVSFIFFLKSVIRNTLKEELKDKILFEELLQIESEIDRMALISFDIYMKCRETLHEIKIKEIKKNTFRLAGFAIKENRVKKTKSTCKGC